MNKPMVVLRLRGGGVLITQFNEEEGDNIINLAKRMSSGFATFQDKLWGRYRELAVNLADVSIIEIIHP